MDFRYKVGEAVKVREDLECHTGYYYMRSGPLANVTHNCMTSEMKQLKGQIVHIAAISFAQYQIVETHDCFWTDEMFTSVKNTECYCESLL